MRHLPFLKALAKVSDIDDPVWRDAAAGYLVLRFFDQWMEEGPARMSKDSGLPALKARIRAMPDVEPKVQQFLLTAIQAMVDASKADPALVAGPLLAYGKYLESAGRLELAAHVYQTLIEVLDSPVSSDPLTAATALMQYGYVARFLGDFDAADAAYQRASILADKTGSKVLSLRAKIGIANTLKTRGNLGDAEALLDKVIAEAVEAGFVNVESWARHSRGSVRDKRGQHVDAMLDLFRAYELTEDTSEREFILGDFAACAGEAGYHRVARDAYRILAYTAQAPLVRSAALINLLEVIAIDGTSADFEHIQTHLAAHAERYPLPTDHIVQVALARAYGTERFGTRAEAITAYRSVITKAYAAGLHQFEFKAEERLNALMAGNTVQESLSIHEPPETLRYVVDSIAEWSALATASV